MSASLQERLREFTVGLLERRGAAVEWPASFEEGYAVLPPEVAKQLHGWELMALTAQAGQEGLAVNLATDFLERVQPLVDSEPWHGAFTIPDLYLKQGRLEELFARTFTWQNVKVRMLDPKPVRVEYHVWYYFATLQSEDRYEDFFSIALNSETGGEVSIPEALECEGVQPWAEAPLAQETHARAVRRALATLDGRAAPFVARMEARRARDHKRLKEYYSALLKEEREVAGGPVDPGRAAGKQAQAVELELQRKLQELDERYRLRLDLTPVVLVRLNLPVLAIPFEVFRRQARRVHSTYWNPLLGALEPLPCESCDAPIFSVTFSNVEVGALCDACAAKGL